MDHDRIERKALINAPQERVWELLTEAEHLGRWFGDAGAEIDLRPGGRIALHWTEHPTAHGRVEKVEPQRFFSYRWIAEGFPRETEPTEQNSTLVEFTLTGEGEGTLLRVVETGFGALDLPEEELEKRIDGNREGWRIKVGDLDEYAQRVVA